jgi:predicted TIM-barrel fold metal-dependent hydrolase
MMMRSALTFAIPAMTAVATLTAAAQRAPLVDHHQHLFSPAFVALVGTPENGIHAITARDLVAMLDSAGIRQAVVLSTAYTYGSPSRKVDDEYAKVQAENDWTSREVAQYPTRLVGFCGVNPLKDYALAEIDRCARDPVLRRGLKMHFGNSDVRLEDSADVAKVRQVFQAANRHHMAIVVHLRASYSRKAPYGEAQARAFIEQVLPAAPDVPVQIAHMASSGPGYQDLVSDSVMAVLAEAVERRDPRVRNLWFDVASLASPGLAPELQALLVKRIRQVGVGRVLFGSDAAAGGNLRPREAWEAFSRLPLTGKERGRIAGNVAPYLNGTTPTARTM